MQRCGHGYNNGTQLRGTGKATVDHVAMGILYQLRAAETPGIVVMAEFGEQCGPL